ncbi:importin subunit alpha-like protein, partial [Trifolium medium]|nr:importin subunit alpha-like protein [Trifolium medium]
MSCSLLLNVSTFMVLQQMMRTDYIKDMYSHDSNVQLTGTTKLAGLLAEDPRLGDLRSEDVHFLIGLLENGEKPELQFYAALALSYVDSNGALIIRMKAIPLLVDLMTSKHVDTQMRGMFILMRIAYDFPNSVGDLHKIGAWELLKDLVYSHQENYYELLNCATFLSIVCRAKAYLSAHEVVYHPLFELR